MNEEIKDCDCKGELFCLAIVFVLFLAGYWFWDYHEFRKTFKGNNEVIIHCLNGQPIEVDGTRFECKKIDLKEKK